MPDVAEYWTPDAVRALPDDGKRYECIDGALIVTPAGEYWIVDIDARTIERWRGGEERPDVCGEEIVWRPDGDGAELRIDLVRFFGEIHGE